MKKCLLVNKSLHIEPVGSWISPIILSDCVHIEKNSLRCILFRSRHNQVFVGFRCLRFSCTDMVNTQSMLRKRRIYGGGYVHSCFLSMLDDIFDRVQKWVLRHMTRNDIVYVTGHGVAGAIAVLCAERFACLQYRPEIYTFGAPKVGDITFASRFGHIPFFRFVLDTDIIPLFPLSGDYVHAGQCLYIDRKHRLKESVRPWKMFLVEWFHKVCGCILFDENQYHCFSRYEESLEECIMDDCGIDDHNIEDTKIVV